jgi:hypothetical protein
MDKKGYLFVSVIFCAGFGSLLGFLAENMMLGFLIGMGVGVAFGTAVSATSRNS